MGREMQVMVSSFIRTALSVACLTMAKCGAHGTGQNNASMIQWQRQRQKQNRLSNRLPCRKAGQRVMQNMKPIKPVNATLLLKIKEQILREPKSFNMDTWEGKGTPPCRTAHCIGGWAIVLSGGTVPHRWEMWQDECARMARKALNITLKQGNQLLFEEKWPAAFQPHNNPGVSLAQIAANRIDAFIAEHSLIV